MSTVQGLNDSEVTALLAGGSLAAKILQRERIRLGWTQDEVAARCGVSRVTVTTWENGTRWPSGINLDKLIVLLSPDSTVIKDKRLEAKVTSQELQSLLHELEQAGNDELERADALITYAYPRVLSTLILKATGAPGVQADARCIEMFFQHKREVRDEQRLRLGNQQRDVTPTSALWSEGAGIVKKAPRKARTDVGSSDVVASGDDVTTTIGSDSAGLHKTSSGDDSLLTTTCRIGEEGHEGCAIEQCIAQEAGTPGGPSVGG